MTQVTDTKDNSALSKMVYDKLMDRIMSLELMPGDAVSEKKIADELGISRAPVRESLRMLENDGLVVIERNRMARVVTLSDDQIREIGTVRIFIDQTSIKLAHYYGSRADFLRMRDAATECEEAFKKGDSKGFMIKDRAFHMLLSKAGGNEFLTKFQSNMDIRLGFVIFHYPNNVKLFDRAVHEHFEITNALLDGDLKRALRIGVDHLYDFYGLSSFVPREYFIE